MLQKIHEQSKGWIAWLVISLVALTFMLWGVQDYLQGRVSDTVITVNGVKISQRQIDRLYQSTRSRLQAQFGADDPNYVVNLQRIIRPLASNPEYCQRCL